MSAQPVTRRTGTRAAAAVAGAGVTEESVLLAKRENGTLSCAGGGHWLFYLCPCFRFLCLVLSLPVSLRNCLKRAELLKGHSLNPTEKMAKTAPLTGSV